MFIYTRCHCTNWVGLEKGARNLLTFSLYKSSLKGSSRGCSEVIESKKGGRTYTDGKKDIFHISICSVRATQYLFPPFIECCLNIFYSVMQGTQRATLKRRSETFDILVAWSSSKYGWKLTRTEAGSQAGQKQRPQP